MGYTHYFYQKRAFTDVEWDRICADTKRICEGQSLDLAVNLHDDDENTPIILLNGLPGFDCEPLILQKIPKKPRVQTPEEAAAEGVFNFVKTARLPYDEFVVAVLKAARAIAPDALTLQSDGGESVFGERPES